MKKLLFIFLLTGTITASLAQSINYGIKAGLNLSKEMHSGGIFGNLNSIPVLGFHIGGIVDLNFRNFTIEPGIFYSTKGDRVNQTLASSDGNLSGTVDASITSDYIELPINLLYKIPLNKDFEMRAGGGPYISYGVSFKGRMPVNGKETDIAITQRNPDYGFNLLAGAVLHHKFIIDAQYGLGFGNLAYYGTARNRVISFSVGYLFQ